MSACIVSLKLKEFYHASFFRIVDKSKEILTVARPQLIKKRKPRPLASEEKLPERRGLAFIMLLSPEHPRILAFFGL